MERYTITALHRDFPDDDTCLNWLFNFLYPDGVKCKNCKKITKHHRVQSRPSYSCDVCGNHVHPTADTIFHKSSTPLILWFYAIFLVASTRSGISAKQIERELGVTYKTAWRMLKQIRSMMGSDNDTPLEGTVEIDESYIGGVQKGNRGRQVNNKKTPVLGMVERGGRVRGQVMRVANTPTMMPPIRKSVAVGATIMTDEYFAYSALKHMGYEHKTIKHKEAYVMGDIHTNSIEGFWSQLKGGIRGVYKHVEPAYLQSYIDEYAFRYSRRNNKQPMFSSLIERVEKA